jgi:hypothetical protein
MRTRTTPGVDGPQVAGAEAPSLQGARAEVLQDDVGAGGQAQRDVASLGAAQVQGDRTVCRGPADVAGAAEDASRRLGYRAGVRPDAVVR